jgi:ankyrin repeat protein
MAWYGPRHEEALCNTVRAIGPPETLALSASDLTTPLEQAISFNDRYVAAAILRAHPKSAVSPFQTRPGSVPFTFPVHLAAQIASHRDTADNVGIIELLHRFHSGCLRPSDGEGRTALHLAVEGLSKLPAAWLLKAAPEMLAIKDKRDRSALFYCGSISCAQLLIESGAKLNVRDKIGLAPLHHYASIGASHLIELSCKKGANVIIRDADGRIPLWRAIESGERESVTILAAATARTKEFKDYLPKALEMALRNQRVDLARILIDQGADTTVAFLNEGILPWEWAIEANHLNLCTLLLGSVDKWAVTPDGNTPLHVAALSNRTAILESLVKTFSHATHLDQRNNEGLTALHVAASKRLTRAARILLHGGSEPNALRLDGSNALHAAIMGTSDSNADGIYDLLISSDVSLFTADRSGNIPWDNAVQKMQLPAIMAILLRRNQKAYQQLYYRATDKKGEIKLEDASHVLFKAAIQARNLDLMRWLLNSSICTEVSISLDMTNQRYKNSRRQWLSSTESESLFGLAMTALHGPWEKLLKEQGQITGSKPYSIFR